MSGLINVIILSLLLGAASFWIGILPLTITSITKQHLSHLSAVGSGLFIGTALGVIIPEGIETLASISPSSSVPTRTIAFSLLCGFTLMFITERYISHSSHSHSHGSHSSGGGSGGAYNVISMRDNPGSATTITPNGGRDRDLANDDDFEATLREIEGHTHISPSATRLEHDINHQGTNGGLSTPTSAFSIDILLDQHEQRKASFYRAIPLTLGLVIHSLADGLALGASSLPKAGGQGGTQLSFVVFLALIVHKSPTALALSTSLISTSLPRAEIKKHIAFFSASTPMGAIISYIVLSAFGESLGGGGDGYVKMTGIALLVSGGTFLYVASLLQSQKDGQTATADGSESESGRAGYIRSALTILGIFLPFFISALVDHDHGGGGHGNDVLNSGSGADAILGMISGGAAGDIA